jgi:hypothetical protein
MIKFKDFKKFDINTISFIDGKISEAEYIIYLNNQMINESFVGDVKEKMLDILYSFLAKAYEIGYKVIDKLNVFIKWFITNLSKIKNPILHKIITLTLIVMILLIISATTANAENDIHIIPKEKIDIAIGWLEHLKNNGKGYDSMELTKGMAHLIDIRDGKVDLPMFNKRVLDVADAALKTADSIIIDAKSDRQNGVLYKWCFDLMEKGSQYVKAIYTKTPSGENIKLFTK